MPTAGLNSDRYGRQSVHGGKKMGHSHTALKASDLAGSGLEKTGENRVIFQGIGLSFQGLEELRVM